MVPPHCREGETWRERRREGERRQRDETMPHVVVERYFDDFYLISVQGMTRGGLFCAALSERAL
jgi:hypothetical protein